MKLLKCILCVLFICVSVDAAAQNYGERNERITAKQANDFYESCLEQSYPANTTEAKELFCACSSARFFQQLRQGDISDLQFPETWQARLAQTKLLDYVYTPCIQDSLKDLIAEECENNALLDEMEHISKTVYCACQNRRMEIVFEDRFGQISEQNRENLLESLADPISSFMQNAIYVQQSEAITGICMNEAMIKFVPTEPLKTGVASLVISKPEHSHNHSGTDEGGKDKIIPFDAVSESGNGGADALEENEQDEEDVVEAVPVNDGPTCNPMTYDEAYKPENIRKDL